MSDRKYNVLFICVGNSARSIFAESLLRTLGGDRFNAYSAGVRPSSELNPFAVQVLKDKGHDVSVLRAKNFAEFTGADAPQLDFVFTVCDQAAAEECPVWEGQPISGHWGMPDPVKVSGTDAEKALGFPACIWSVEASDRSVYRLARRKSGPDRPRGSGGRNRRGDRGLSQCS